MKQIPPFKYYFPKKIKEWILNKINDLIEKGEYLTNGKYVKDFETKFSSYINTKYAIAVSSGTAALEIIFQSLKIKNKEVILPTNTFIATAYGVLRSKGKISLVDIDYDLCINFKEVKSNMNENTKAVLPVHIGGFISKHIEELIELCKENNIPLIEDSAHALGSEYKNKKAGSLGFASAFSFFSTKILTTGEGGMITTNDYELAYNARILRDQGKIKGNEIKMLGYNWRMTEIQAIIGLAQLSIIEEILEKRRKIAKIYTELIEEKIKERKNKIEILKPNKNLKPNYYKFILFLPKNKNPEILKKYLKEKYNIELSGYVYEIPLHEQKPLKRYIYNKNFPIANDLCKRHISLPIYPQMEEKEIVYIVDSLFNSLEKIN